MKTNIFHRTLHRSLWQWLADNPSKSKEDWVGWKSNGGDVEEPNENHCFACEYNEGYRCIECPLVWNYQKHGNACGSIWYRWDASTDPTERTELALKIKDLPVKDGVVCD